MLKSYNAKTCNIKSSSSNKYSKMTQIFPGIKVQHKFKVQSSILNGWGWLVCQLTEAVSASRC